MNIETVGYTDMLEFSAAVLLNAVIIPRDRPRQRCLGCLPCLTLLPHILSESYVFTGT